MLRRRRLLADEDGRVEGDEQVAAVLGQAYTAQPDLRTKAMSVAQREGRMLASVSSRSQLSVDCAAACSGAAGNAEPNGSQPT